MESRLKMLKMRKLIITNLFCRFVPSQGRKHELLPILKKKGAMGQERREVKRIPNAGSLIL